MVTSRPNPNSSKPVLLSRCSEDSIALRQILVASGHLAAPLEIDFGHSKSIDEFRMSAGYASAFFRKIREIYLLFGQIRRAKPTAILYCTPHPAIRIYRALFDRSVRCICYLRTQHFLHIPQSLSDLVALKAQRIGLRSIVLNNYHADTYLVPGEINRDYVRWRSCGEQRCVTIGAFPRVARTEPTSSKARVVIATQNWRGHGFAEIADQQIELISQLYQELRTFFLDQIVVRPHPRDLDNYANLICDRSERFLDSVNEFDIVVTSLSSFATDCWLRGANIVFFAPKPSLNYVEPIFSKYNVLYHQTSQSVCEAVRSRLQKQASHTDSFLEMTVSTSPNPVPEDLLTT
jgi:hypothetical protein